MRVRVLASMLLVAWDFSIFSSGAPARSAAQPDAGGVLRRLTIANFGGSGTNTIQAVATDPTGNIFIAGTTNSPDFPVKNALQSVFGDAGILRTTDLGNTWTRVPAPLDVSSVYPDPVAPQILFGGGSAGIYKSVDGGATWQVVYRLQSGIALQSLAIDPGNHLHIAALIFGTASGSILIRSLDGGSTWSASPPSTNGGRLVVDPTGSGALVVVGLGDYISRDWGLTATEIYPKGGVGNASTVAFDPSHQGWIYLNVAAGSTGTLWLSTDFGVTWTQKASPPTGFTDIMGLAVDPNVPTTLVAATADGFYLSTDGAASWTRTTGSAPFFPDSRYPFVLVDHHCSPGGGLFAIGSGAGFIGTFTVAFSPDDGFTWNSPQLTRVTGVAAGAGCATYVTRAASTSGLDAFIAKLSPNGAVLWATYLGGSDQDTPAGLAVDMQGNAYVAGTTYSPDFPSTLPRIGVAGADAVFVTKFWPDGTLVYSVLISGEASQTAAAVAVDAGQDVYVVGNTNSTKFPVTPGALVSQASMGSSAGFLVKLSPTGAEASGTYLGGASPSAIVLGSDGDPTLAGTGQPPGLPAPPPGNPSGFLVKLDPTASNVIDAAYLPGMSAGPLAIDNQGNLFVAGNSPPTSGAYVSPPSSSGCGSGLFIVSPVSVSKLSANWKTLYTAQLNAPCGIRLGAMAIEGSGAVVVGLYTGPGFPLHDPLLAGPTCSGDYASAIAELSPDGSTLEFATYLDDCGVPAIALAGDASVYAGVNSSGGAVGVLHLKPPNPPALSVDWISNAFSGDSNAVVGGGLYTITGTGFQPPSLDLGLNPTQNLPTELGGVQVKFSGIPAAVMRTAPGLVAVVAPEKLALPADAAPPEAKLADRFTVVQLFYNGQASNAALMPVAAVLPGLLTNQYPNPQPGAQPDGTVRNQDGTLNDANHPASASSTITLFVTGMGATKPPVVPDSLAASTSVVPLADLWSTWQRNTPAPIPSEPMYSVPGFLSAIFQIQVQVPNPLPSGFQQVGNGVERVPIGFFLNPPPLSPVARTASNQVNVYVK